MMRYPMKFFDLPKYDPNDIMAVEEVSRWMVSKFPDLVPTEENGKTVILSNVILGGIGLNKPMTVVVGKTGNGKYVIRCNEKIVYDVDASEIHTIPYIFPVAPYIN